MSAFSEEGSVGDRELGRISRENSLCVSASVHVTHMLWVVYLRFWSLLFAWAMQLPNKFIDILPPLAYIILLICWSLGCIRLQNHIHLTLTTLHRSKIPLRLIWSICSVFFCFDHLFWTTFAASKTCSTSLGSKYTQNVFMFAAGTGPRTHFWCILTPSVANDVLPRW